MRTMRELDDALPERTGHGGVVLYGGGDQFGGKPELQSYVERVEMRVGATT
jgi:cell division ATPase FtsA